MSRKINKIVAGILLLIFIFGTKVVLAENQSENTPFKVIWDAIDDLQQQIADIKPQDPKGVSLKIVDANDQEVGFLLDFQDPYSIPKPYSFEVWNPSMQKILIVSRSFGVIDSIPITTPTYYKSTDCSGASYKFFNGTVDPYILYKVDPKDFDGLTWVNVLESTASYYSRMESYRRDINSGCASKSLTIPTAQVEAIPAPPTFVVPLSIVEQ